MKKLILYCLFLLPAPVAVSQFYLRGAIHDEKDSPLPNAKIYLYSARMIYNAGRDGSFGISCKLLSDSLRISLDGYEDHIMPVRTDAWQMIVLKPSADAVVKNRPKLISFTADKKQESKHGFLAGDETYFKLVENEIVKTDDYPNTGFSLNVNKASYSNVRRFINMGSPVPPDAVRIEEMVNYFGLNASPPSDEDLFKINSRTGPCPWNSENRLLFLNINAKKLDLSKIPPGNFVFLVDISGSMDMPNRLPLLKAAFQMFVKNLRAQDRISIVVYGGTVGVWLPPTPGDEKDKINRAIEVLVAAGDTPGESAISAAYKVALSAFIPGGTNRVILATDGDFNVGQTSEKALDELITKQRHSGVYLTCLGVGMGNFKDSKLQTLAKRGNGNYAYLDDIREAEKVLVHELTETFYAVADNSFLNINFSPQRVKSYRLIGFDNKKEALTQTASEMEGGEIGSGSSTTAIFEYEPADGPAITAPATVSIRYRACNDTLGGLKFLDHEVTDPAPADSLCSSDKFAAAVALYGMKLKDSKYAKNASWPLIAALAKEGAERGNYLQEEFLLLVDKSITVYNPRRKKKSKTF